MKTIQVFKKDLASALENSIQTLFQKIGNERLYGVSLFLNEDFDFSSACISANTEEALISKAAEYAQRWPEYSGKRGEKLLRWSVADWGYFNFSSEVEKLKFPPGDGARRDSSLYRAIVDCLLALKEKECFAINNPQVVFSITCHDMTDDFFLEGLGKLNSASVTEDYVRNFTAIPILNELRALPAANRLEVVSALYRDLTLGIDSETALNASARNANQYNIQAIFHELGSDGIARLLDLIEAHGFGAIFNPRDSAAYRRFGAFTAENTLATSAIFLVGEIARVRNEHIKRMQRILARRVEADKSLPITSTLAENIARILHRLRPKRFPESVLDRKTSHLLNPEPFLPRR